MAEGERRADPAQLDRGALHAALVTHRSTLEDIKQGRTAKGTDYAVERAITAYLDALRREGLLGAGLTSEEVEPLGSIIERPPDCTCDAALLHKDDCALGRYQRLVRSGRAKLRTHEQVRQAYIAGVREGLLGADGEVIDRYLTPAEFQEIEAGLCARGASHKSVKAVVAFIECPLPGWRVLRSLSGRQGAGT